MVRKIRTLTCQNLPIETTHYLEETDTCKGESFD